MCRRDAQSDLRAGADRHFSFVLFHIRHLTVLGPLINPASLKMAPYYHSTTAYAVCAILPVQPQKAVGTYSDTVLVTVTY
jgi:hypothetical protein